jgi:hypothetical protein
MMPPMRNLVFLVPGLLAAPSVRLATESVPANCIVGDTHGVYADAVRRLAACPRSA